jgi:hypothetical protein
VIDGEQVPSNSLYCEGTGRVESETPHVAAMAAMAPSASGTRT